MAESIQFRVGTDDTGERVDRLVSSAALARGFELSNRQAKALVESGAVRINGRQVQRASQRVAPGDLVDVAIPAQELVDSVGPIDLSAAVLFRDEHIVVVNKPSGLPTHATHDKARDHAQAAVQRLVGEGGYVAVHHRLDVETSGVLVFAIDRGANKGLADAFAGREVQKTYVAVVSRADLPDEFDVDNHLGRDRHDRRRMAAVRSGGDHARTEFGVRARSEHSAAVEARPLTGRMHQIRVHLAGFGAPIVGDVMYGGVVAARLMLHAERLVLRHPVSGHELDLRAPVPEDFAREARQRGLEV